MADNLPQMQTDIEKCITIYKFQKQKFSKGSLFWIHFCSRFDTKCEYNVLILTLSHNKSNYLHFVFKL